MRTAGAEGAGCLAFAEFPERNGRPEGAGETSDRRFAPQGWAQKVWARKIAVTTGAASSSKVLARNDIVRAGRGSR